MNLDHLHEAFVKGDMERVRAELGHPSDFPNGRFGLCEDLPLEYALYHAPIALVRALLEAGADANFPSKEGSPSLFAALSSNHPDRGERVALLLDFGADIHQRCVNDFTPLHVAATRNQADAVALLLSRGADPNLRTRIDHYATPLEEATRYGALDAAEMLQRPGGR